MRTIVKKRARGVFRGLGTESAAGLGRTPARGLPSSREIRSSAVRGAAGIKKSRENSAFRGEFSLLSPSPPLAEVLRDEPETALGGLGI